MDMNSPFIRFLLPFSCGLTAPDIDFCYRPESIGIILQLKDNTGGSHRLRKQNFRGVAAIDLGGQIPPPLLL